MEQQATTPLPAAPAAIVLAAALVSVLVGCDPLPALRDAPVGDLRAPLLVREEVTSDGSVILEFDEAVSLVPDSLRLAVGAAGGQAPAASRALEGQVGPVEGYGRIAPVEGAGERLELAIGSPVEPGREYAVEAAVRDAAGNSLTLVLPFYGPNPDAAGLILNELLVKTTTKSRDCIELRVTKAGSIGGMAVFVGVPTDFDACYVFPDVRVTAGDFIVLHCKPEGKPGEIDETGALDAASGADCTPGARDFFWREAPGLPDETGIVTLAANPLGAIADAVFYSNKVTTAGKDYRSFGTSKMLARAEELERADAWKCRDPIAVEDACPSGALTGTRSLCRASSSADTDAAADWHTVPNRKASIGAVNSDEVYVAP